MGHPLGSCTVSVIRRCGLRLTVAQLPLDLSSVSGSSLAWQECQRTVSWCLVLSVRHCAGVVERCREKVDFSKSFLNTKCACCQRVRAEFEPQTSAVLAAEVRKLSLIKAQAQETDFLPSLTLTICVQLSWHTVTGIVG